MFGEQGPNSYKVLQRSIAFGGSGLPGQNCLFFHLPYQLPIVSNDYCMKFLLQPLHSTMLTNVSAKQRTKFTSKHFWILLTFYFCIGGGSKDRTPFMCYSATNSQVPYVFVPIRDQTEGIPIRWTCPNWALTAVSGRAYYSASEIGLRI